MIRNNTSHKAKKVLVALSGGVDSAVAAALLKKRGFDVVGVFFRFFDGASAEKSLGNAQKIAKKLGIPLEIIDARRGFRKKIIDYFVLSYKKGITPNPCVHCNREMKFDLLFGLLEKHKANHIATGHYARIFLVIARSAATKQSRAILENTRLLHRARNDKYKLCEAKDKSKDQSYFLYRLTQRELSKIIFPLGEYDKTETKKMAKKLKLPVLGDEESQDICFLLDKDINSFLQNHIPSKEGSITDEAGKILGKHKGLPFYTIGQRKGIEIGPPTSRQQREVLRASGPGPYFVIGKNARKNELVVSNDPKKLLAKIFFVSEVNWVNKGIKLPLHAKVQIRYHSEKISAIIERGKLGKYVIELKKPLRAATPGQSAVFYRKDEVLGGGIIV